MLEAQRKWYIPAPLSLGWHSGFWNLIGGIGFAACGAFGISTRHWAQYQSTLCTFWGSWAFLIGSLIQWYEAVSPIRGKEQDEEKGKGREDDTSSNSRDGGNENRNDTTDGQPPKA
ncbi:hypothetical protein M422DRAFT_255823 [Sphaerobolus stellatus SS14]|nr:hypothetical protein M422DRAFT_255823 [Sphaerobolus stellatus SS14]